MYKFGFMLLYDKQKNHSVPINVANEENSFDFSKIKRIEKVLYLLYFERNMSSVNNNDSYFHVPIIHCPKGTNIQIIPAKTVRCIKNVKCFLGHIH